LIIGGAILCLAVSVQAGIISGSFDCQFPSDPEQTYNAWNFDYDLGRLNLSQVLSTILPPEIDRVVMSGIADSDPTFTVVKTVTNTTGITWTGYDMMLLGDAVFSDGASSSMFNTHSFELDFKTLHFYAPNPVLDGQSVTMTVEINIPSSGGFNFTMQQQAIPEPVSILLFGLGGIILLKKKNA
jgi:hypothetical protein